MKIKKFSKKLALGKETVSNLDIFEMNYIQGGEDTDPGSSCVLCPTEGGICAPSTRCPPLLTDTDCYETIEYACFTKPEYGGFC
jgi:hypothetical protein